MKNTYKIFDQYIIIDINMDHFLDKLIMGNFFWKMSYLGKISIYLFKKWKFDDFKGNDNFE